MRLVVDTSVLIGELLRKAGRERLGDSRLDLFLPEQMWDETKLMLPRRVQQYGLRNGLDDQLQRDLTATCLSAVSSNVDILPEAVYAAQEYEARARSVRDPADWPVVACSLALNAAVWTNDNDFLGTGIATWTTNTLDSWLRRAPEGTTP